MNQVILIGRLVRHPEMKVTPSLTPIANFTLAVDRGMSKEKRQEAENSGKPTADFIRVTVAGKMAEACEKHLAKGKQCAVQGHIQTGSYKAANGETRYTTDVVASRVQFLEWGESKPQSDSSSDFESEFEGTSFDASDDAGYVPF